MSKKQRTLGTLFQERLYEDPFWMLVSCSLVNLTTWRQAEAPFEKMREMSGGDPAWFSQVDDATLNDILRPLGLWRRRSGLLRRMAAAWVESPPETHEDVLDLPGCGKYASDSWAIFVEGIKGVEPRDHLLNLYVEKNG